MRAIVLFGLATVLAGCEGPPPEAFVSTSGRGGPAAVAIGNDAAGEACTLIRTGAGGDIICGAWDSPSARVREIAPPAGITPAESVASAVSGQLACGAPAATTILGDQPASLFDCRRRNGGWAAFALAATAGGKSWQADGIAPASPAAIRAIGVLSGLTQPDGPMPASAALDRIAARLARESFGAGSVQDFETLMALGRDANQAERFVASETAYRAALGIQERVQGANAPDAFAPLVRLALQVSNQGRFPEAERLFDRAATLAPRAADPLAGALLAHHRGLHLANRGDNDAALAMLARADAAYAAALPPAGPGAGRGDHLALDVPQSRAVVGMVETRRNRAAILRVSGRAAESEAMAREAADLARRAPGAANTDLIAARLARTTGAAASAAGATGTADRDFANAAARFARGLPRSRPYADTLLLRAATAPPSMVPGLCRDAIAVLSELREGTTPNRIAPCVDALAAGTDQDRLAEAFAAAQLAQGGVTATQIARAAARLGESSANPAVSDAIRGREAAQAQLAALFRRRDAVVDARAPGGQQALAALDAEIVAAEARFADADAAAQAAAPNYPQLVQSVAGAAEVLAALRPGEALAATFLPAGQRHGWMFVLAEGRITAGRIDATEAEITALVARIRDGVEAGDDSRPFDAGAAHALHQALFAGVAAPVQAAKSLVVAPSGPLLSIPFGLLVEQAPPDPRSHAGAAFLLTRLPVSHVPAAASLVALRKAGPSRASRPWFGFGDPRPVPAAVAARSFPAAPECGRLLSALPSLPTAALELRASAAFFGAGAQQQRVGSAFTVPAVERAELRDYRILHFATHGLLPAELVCLSDPTIVASVPAGARDAGGALLTSSAVLELDLDADVVVLSACNTGGGSTGGESLSTLARAFFYAGARSLLVTHWYVNDVAATRIIAIALRNVSQGQGFAEALRAAQLDFAALPGGGHPGLWAPFALVGAGPEGRAHNL